MKRTGVFGILLVMLVTMALGTGCTKYASEEELQMLDDQRNAALQAEQALSDCESEATRLEREKAALQADLQDVKAEKAAVKQRLDEKDGMMKLDKNEEAAKMTKRILILAIAVLFVASLTAPAFAQDRKMEYEAYMAEMDKWAEREATAKAGLEDCDSKKVALNGDISGLKDEIAGVWSEIYDMLGITEADVDAFAAELDAFEKDLSAFGRLSPEQMYQRQDELDALKARLDELAMNPAALLTQFKTRIDGDYAKIENYRGRMAGPRNIKYTVARGDHLWGISAMPKHYGDGAKWMRIYSVNREQIDNPDLIFPNQVFTIPMEIDKKSQYLVERGDYLAKVSEMVYGDPFQWRKIYEANKDLVPDPNLLYTNTILTIPGR